MGLRGWWDRVSESARWDGTSGRPRSANGASSFHLFWEVPAGDWVGAEATFEVVEPPRVAQLYFWALQVNFLQGSRAAGGAHFGLQWFPPHPGSTAVNWGGYGPAGGELDGSVSPLPSAPGNPNTRDYVWHPHRPYRYRIHPTPAATGAWRGEVVDLTTGETTVVRDLFVAADRIASPMVWSEVFAACDDPTVVVQWSDLTVVHRDGTAAKAGAASVNYQAIGDGGCANTTITTTGDAFVQTTATTRTTRQGATLRLG